MIQLEQLHEAINQTNQSYINLHETWILLKYNTQNVALKRKMVPLYLQAPEKKSKMDSGPTTVEHIAYTSCKV